MASTRSSVRPAYILLGRDTAGASHVYRTTDETIHVVQGGEHVQRFDLGAQSVDDYVTFVRDDVDDREWETRSYIAGDENPFASLTDNTNTGVSA